MSTTDSSGQTGALLATVTAAGIDLTGVEDHDWLPAVVLWFRRGGDRDLFDRITGRSWERVEPPWPASWMPWMHGRHASIVPLADIPGAVATLGPGRG